MCSNRLSEVASPFDTIRTQTRTISKDMQIETKLKKTQHIPPNDTRKKRSLERCHNTLCSSNSSNLYGESCGDYTVTMRSVSQCAFHRGHKQ